MYIYLSEFYKMSSSYSMTQAVQDIQCEKESKRYNALIQIRKRLLKQQDGYKR